ncbi:hypothetical protein GCM10023082_50310 [Streptomyces tremellae]|uniref:Lipoprotein n=1 Tax=Streptomyces tremellae TaxID=1124239 RepID=A0ABP7FVZ0_9ACTN
MNAVPRRRRLGRPPPPTWHRPAGLDGRRSFWRALLAAFVLAAGAASACSLKSGDSQSHATAGPGTVADAVHQELHLMFLADLAFTDVTRDSGRLGPRNRAHRIAYPKDADTLAIRCYGTGRVHVETALKDGGSRRPPDIRCGPSVTAHLVKDEGVDSVLVVLKGDHARASWALTRSRRSEAAGPGNVRSTGPDCHAGPGHRDGPTVPVATMPAGPIVLPHASADLSA